MNAPSFADPRGHQLRTLRTLTFSIAYRMLGSVADAEDVVQESFLRFHRAQSEGTAIESPKAFVASIATRLSIDHLRSARVRREQYVGTWLPEPVVDEREPDAERRLEHAESLSMAFLVMLEALSPIERAVFVLREVFDYAYEDIAAIVEKTSRQLPADFRTGAAAIGPPAAALRELARTAGRPGATLSCGVRGRRSGWTRATPRHRSHLLRRRRGQSANCHPSAGARPGTGRQVAQRHPLQEEVRGLPVAAGGSKRPARRDDPGRRRPRDIRRRTRDRGRSRACDPVRDQPGQTPAPRSRIRGRASSAIALTSFRGGAGLAHVRLY